MMDLEWERRAEICRFCDNCALQLYEGEWDYMEQGAK
jgi:hypothetical protein